MNFSLIRYIISSVLEFQSLFLVLPCIVALIYQEKSGWAYVIVMLASFALGWLGKRKKPANKEFFAKEGLVTVSLSWIVLSVTGAIPFVLSGEIPSFTDALFETVSGLTTTGATILKDVEVLSYCNLFWRSFTHWIGGMGVLTLMLAVMQLAGGNNMYLMRAESPGPKVGKLTPRMKQTARALYGIYMAMTVVLILLLLCSGMNLFESVTIAAGTAGTGGFAILNSSIATYPLASQIIITIFMFLFGVNFTVYYFFVTGKRKEALKHEEMRYYLLIVLAAIGLITWNLRDFYGSILNALHQAAFQVSSIITTTGYATTDFNNWPEFSKTILVLLMFIGACAGSTGGGIKVSRIVILIKLVRNEISHLVHPNRVKQVRFENRVVQKETWRAILVFLAAYLGIFSVSLLAVSLRGLDFFTNFTAVATTLNNVGPGFAQVGPTSNFSVYGSPEKWVFVFDMLVGRLEIFPMLVLLTPSTWKKGF